MRHLRFVLIAVGLTLGPQMASAQFYGVGGHIGGEFDNSEDWIVFGVDGRYRVPNSSWTLAPRFNLHPVDGGSIYQIDVNALYNFPRDASLPIHPYLGVGVGLFRESFDGFSETKLVANLVSGVRVVRSTSKVEPYIQTQYSFAKEFSNSMTFLVGAIYRLGNASAAFRPRSR